MDGCVGRIGRHDTHRSVQAIRLERRQEADLGRMAFFVGIGFGLSSIPNSSYKPPIHIQTIILRRSMAAFLAIEGRPISQKFPCLERQATPNRSERPDIVR